jgi:PelA/Pel-15E family pectate lyase
MKLASMVNGTAIVALCTLAGLCGATPAPRPWPPDQFRPVTAERIAALPVAQQAAWRAYWAHAQDLAKQMPAPAVPEYAPLQPLPSSAAVGARITHGLRLDAPAEWYASAEAQTIADRVVASQSAVGGWTKGNDYLSGQPVAGGNDLWSRGTFDNDATIYELRFLARVIAANPEGPHAGPWRDSFRSGLKYVFDAQYPNGGFPQVYPLAGGYHDAITFNDDAMVHALALLESVAAGAPGYDWISPELRAEAGRRLARGIDCVLATQLHGPRGQLTAWCQQYDALTLQPCAARNFEPIATCTRESLGLVEFLMHRPQPTPEITAAVEGACGWLRAVALQGLVWKRNASGANELLPSPGAPALWARFYEIGTDQPIFGDRDRTIHYDVREISAERRDGYAWYGTWAEAVLARYEARKH